MSPALRLQLACLALLWLQLLLSGQLQALVGLVLALLLVLRLRRQQLPRPLLLGVTLAALAAWGLGASFGDRTAMLQSSCNLLWLLCGLKLLEARSPREQSRCSLLLLLAVGLAGLGAQGLGASLLQGVAALLALSALLALEGGPQPLGRLLRHSTGLVGLALPLLIASFVLLPRLEPLWSLQLGNQGRTGLSQRLAPGELASLVQDDGMAARVRIAAGQLPPPEQRYWRVLVHRHLDGASWTPGDAETALPPLPAATPTGSSIQSWLVEPNGLRQRPWSGSGRPTSAALQITSTGTLVGRSALQQRSLYSVAAVPNAQPWQQIPPSAADLQLPPAANPQLRALGQRWQREAANAEQRLLLARRWYLEQGFRYTLEPGALGTINPLDGFLFETRAGFCEHFAASLSALMRSAGVPARVVVGYQGGSWQQPIGSSGHLELRNSDAHAWSEVWLAGRGWVRVDPTGWVVPERVRRSLAASLGPADRARLTRPMPPWLQGLTGQWRGLDYRWQLWVMGFDRQRQRALLGEGPRQGSLALAAMAAALGLALWPMLRAGRERDPIRRELQQLLRRLARRGLPLLPGESLNQYCKRAGSRQPTLAPALLELGQRYETWRFGPQPPSPVQRTALLAALRRCRKPVARISAING